MREVKPNQTYKHFKGHVYKIVCIALDSETLQKQVIYQDVTDENKIWVRDYEEFISLVDKKKYPDVKQEYRFMLLND